MSPYYVLDKVMAYWLNMVRNYREDVHDNDFFDILCRSYSHERAIRLVESAYTKDELKKMEKARRRWSRLDLSDGLECVFTALWNDAPTRDKCRGVLERIHDEIVSGGRKRRGEADPVEMRIAEVRRLLKLTDLETEILTLAYICDQTCFGWPVHLDDREKPLYYAMALDRYYSEVAKAMTAKGALRKFGLLDGDWDFNTRSLGGYMDGTDADALERRFYVKCEDDDVLPWEFYGDIASTDGEIIREMLKAADGRCNILLYGAPGTGKTEFVKYLGKALDRKVLVVKGSDILSKWVGGSEQNIAAAFRMAESERAVLFFDEVDGLLQSRENARASHEVSRVNELLQQMENFDGVMVAATNFSQNLDPAVMRRFTFKLEFGYLDDAGKKSFFERMFKTKLSEDEFAELRALSNLAPGDFRTVRQEQFYLAGSVTNGERIAALKEECAVKKDGGHSAVIGFAA